jgi:hypothetical protein
MTRSKPRPPKHTLVLVRPPREPSEIRALIKLSERRAASAGMTVKSYRAEEGRLVGESAARPILLLRPLDAKHLYESLHRDRVLVLAFNTVWVRRNPSRDPPARRSALKVETFVAYKSVYGTVLDARSIEAHFGRYAAWARAVACSGDNDPRALPLHVFETTRVWSSLEDPAVAREFSKRFGSPPQRRDDGGKTWTRPTPGAFHGGGVLTVAGRALSQGMHWDVDTDRRTATLHATHEVWQLPRRGGYVNVHPNAYVRRSARSRARLVWSAASP